MFLKNKRKVKIQNDDAPATQSAKKVKRLFIIGVSFLVIFFVLWGAGAKKQRDFINAFSTPLNSQLYFLISQNQVELQNIVASKDYKTIALRIHYSETTREKLSMFGDNYSPIVYFANENQKPKNLKIEYGFFGTNGDGLLILSADEPFKNKAFLAGVLSLESITSPDDNNSLSSTPSFNSSLTSNSLNSGDDINEDQQIKQELADRKEKIANSPKDKESEDPSKQNGNEIGHDSVFMRVNPYSKSTKFFNSKVKNGVDYQEIIKTLFVNDTISDYKKNLKKEKSDLELLEKQINESKKKYDVLGGNEAQNDYENKLSQKNRLEEQIKSDQEKLESLENKEFGEKDLKPVSKKQFIESASNLNQIADQLVKSGVS